MLLKVGACECVVSAARGPQKTNLHGDGVKGQVHRRRQVDAAFGNLRACWEGYEKVITRLAQGCKVTKRLHIWGI